MDKDMITETMSNIEMARIYLQEARRTKHRGWAFTLLNWAANRRRAAMAERFVGQLDLF